GGAAPARRGAGGDGGDDADRRRVRRAAGRDRRRGRARGAGGDARGLLTAAPALPLVPRSTSIRLDPTDRSPTARPSVSLGGGWSGTGWQAGVDRSVPSRDSSFLWLHQDALAATCPRWCGRSAPAWPTAMA